jgi:predicted membrane protein
MHVLLQVLGIIAVLAMVTTFLLRPGSMFAVALAVLAVVAGIVVSWRDVERYREQRAVAATQQSETAAATPELAAPPYPRSGT